VLNSKAAEFTGL